MTRPIRSAAGWLAVLALVGTSPRAGLELGRVFAQQVPERGGQAGVLEVIRLRPTAGFEGACGLTPHYSPGKNPSIGELTTLYGIPGEAVLGGAAGLYPEYRKSLEANFVHPNKCQRKCGGPPR